jgi:hypothetical protein
MKIAPPARPGQGRSPRLLHRQAEQPVDVGAVGPQGQAQVLGVGGVGVQAALEPLPFGAEGLRHLADQVVDQLAGLLGLGRDPTTQTTEPTETSAGSTAIRISVAQPYDPPRGDGTENDEAAGNAIDRRQDTSWTTEGYKSARFGQLKDGVGLVLDLGSARRPRQLDLSLISGGADFTLYAADGDAIPPGLQEGWQKVGGQPDAPEDVTVDLSGDAHRYYLVWFTNLPPDGSRFRAGIREASFKS